MIDFIKRTIKNEKGIKVVFILACVSLAFFVAVIEPINAGPDESMKMVICKYVADYGKLPHGGEDAVRDSIWGISYGFTPITPYIFAGFFIKIAEFFTQDMHVFYVVSRLVTVICYGIFVLFNIKIGDKLFKNKYYKSLFIGFTCLLPQMIFIGSYVNNDCFAMMSISVIIYTWLTGVQDGWSNKTCIKLGLAVGLCALSYYNAYGYILASAILFIVSQLKNKEKINQILKKGLIVFGVSFLVAGWWFIRSAIIYDGDFLGLATTDKYSNEYAVDEFKASQRLTPQKMGMSLKTMLIDESWISLTLRSFVGIFGGMDIPIKYHVFIIATLILFAGCIGYLIFVIRNKNKNNLIECKQIKFIEYIFMICVAIPVILSLYYSYASDFQPQGRYIMPALVPLMYFVTLGIMEFMECIVKNKKVRKIMKIALILVLSYILISSLITLISTYV